MSTIQILAVSNTGKRVFVGSTVYECSTRADQLTKKELSQGQYFVSVRYGGTIYVDAKHPLTRPLAKGIMIANNSTVGVWATSQSYARGISGASPYLDEQHKAAEGYFYHYHIHREHKAHCWYL